MSYSRKGTFDMSWELVQSVCESMESPYESKSVLNLNRVTVSLLQLYRCIIKHTLMCLVGLNKIVLLIQLCHFLLLSLRNPFRIPLQKRLRKIALYILQASKGSVIQSRLHEGH